MVIKELITEYIVTKTFDAIISAIKSYRQYGEKKLVVSKNDIEAALQSHLNYVVNWASEISFRDLQKSKRVKDTYIELDLYVTPKRIQLLRDKNTISLLDAFKDINQNLVILGNPGAGKTTSMKFICNKILYDVDFLKDKINVPILIRLRDLKTFNKYQGRKQISFIESIYFHVYELLGIRIEFKEKNSSSVIDQSNYIEHERFLQRIIIDFLDEMKVMLILDGLDEVVSIQRNHLIQEIRDLSLQLNHAKIILTCRTGEYLDNIENTQVFELCQLTNAQIKDFIGKWFCCNETAALVYEAIVSSPFKDTLVRPLTLAHLCAIYDRYGRIPEKPKVLYKKIVALLIEEWDSQRGIKRNTKFNNFDTDRKIDFLCNLAFHFTSKLQKLIFSSDEFRAAYEEICYNFNLPKSEAVQVADELESHTGIFVQIGYAEFEFAHKSLQEYLTAEYIVRLPKIPFDNTLLYKLSNELALAVSISSNSTSYFSNLILVNLEISRNISIEFIKNFLTRLMLERPDFIASPILGVAFLVLVEKFSNHSSQEVFLDFFRIDEIRQSVNLLEKYYSINLESQTAQSMHIQLVNVASIDNDVTSKVYTKIQVPRTYWRN